MADEPFRKCPRELRVLRSRAALGGGGGLEGGRGDEGW